MKTRAAIAEARNKPIEIHEVDLDGPRAGGELINPDEIGQDNVVQAVVCRGVEPCR